MSLSVEAKEAFGDLCAGCGGEIDGKEGEGFPRYCSESCYQKNGNGEVVVQIYRPKKQKRPRTHAEEITRAVDRCVQAVIDARGQPFNKEERKTVAAFVRAIITPPINQARGIKP